MEFSLYGRKGSYWILIFIIDYCRRFAIALPSIMVDSNQVVLAEKQSATTLLITASCSGGTGSCSVNLVNLFPTNPCGNCFSVSSCGLQYCLSYISGIDAFDPSVTSRYVMTLDATDDIGDMSSVVVDVFIKPNTPPYWDITSYPDMHLTATLSNGGSISVSAEDDDGDGLIYTMTTVPDSVSLDIESATGTIYTIQDLQNECRLHVACLVYVQDLYHADPIGPLAVSVTFNDFNYPPLLNNLDTVLYVIENEAVGTTVLPIAAVDDMTNPTLTYTVSTFPTSSDHLFNIVGNNLVVKSALNYEEETTPISLSIQASDGTCSTDKHTLVVHLVDVNEPPVIQPIDQTVETCEGLISITPTWDITDPDNGDTVTFIDLLPNQFGRFAIDPITGIVSTLVDYDVDENNMAANVVMVMTVSDQGGETATSTLTVRFVDCNDNAPEWTLATAGTSFAIRDCDPPGSFVGSVPAATDIDSSHNQNNVFSYSGSADGVNVMESGSVVLTRYITAGEVVTLPVYATDQGLIPGPLTSKPFYVSVFATPCPTTPPPVTTAGSGVLTANENSFLQSQLGWFVPALLMSTILAALLFYVIWRYCSPNLRHYCTQRPTKPGSRKTPTRRRSVSPIGPSSPPPRDPGPGMLFGWWKETYQDKDYKEMPDRQALPEPNQGPEVANRITYDDEAITSNEPLPSSKSRCQIL